MKKIITKTSIGFIVFLYTIQNTFAQASEETLDNKMNDFLSSSNKLYAVISILVTIFTGIIIYLIYQDNKIRKIEKEIKNKSSRNL
jgi:hypothetical protein